MFNLKRSYEKAFIDLGGCVVEYRHQEIEKKWQQKWEESRIFEVTEDPAFSPEKRRYVLDMFPYPSGAGLHVGHPEGYTATDIYCRYLKMQGYNVLHPMGFDSFGLPAENYAIKTNTHPAITTEKNINRFREQIKSLGMCYDWSREVITSEPDYYGWTQWLFLKLWEKGLAYEAELPINWCESCMTGLANEEVKDGHCERCGGLVRRRGLRQWVLKITAYAERLLADVDKLDWPEAIKAMQRNWIGKSTGAEVTFEVEGIDETLTVYTTRPDTLFGATYMVLAPEHPLVAKVTTPEQHEAVQAYQHQASHKSDLERTELNKEKTGVFTGGYGINPVNGKKLPLWISDYVMMGYGTGAIMAVPAHDERDWEFATKFGLPIVPVLEGGDVTKAPFTEDGSHVNSDFLDGLGKEEGIQTMVRWLEDKGLGKASVKYKLRDWLFSRQRYWGEPIPLVHCPCCGTVPVPEDQLPLTLPQVESYKPSGSGESPLAAVESWVNTTCPKCGGPAKRETNTMPQWAGSCWYYLRYLDPKNTKAFASPEAIDYWMPVDLYVGGAEHAVLHLLYARFWHKVFFDLGLVNTDEPFKRLVNQGMITSYAYQRPNKTLVPTDEVEAVGDGFVEKATGTPVERVIAKMSKSLKNVINPDEVVNEMGADSLRLYEMFMGPLEQSKPWSTQGVIGVRRFLEKVCRLSEKPLSDAPIEGELAKAMHKTIQKVTADTEALSFNTAIAQLMTFTTELSKAEELPKEGYFALLKLLCPYAPHLAEELWEKAGQKPFLSLESWPAFDEALTKDDTITLVVQINGKVREKIDVPANCSKEEMIEIALAHPGVQKRLEGLTLRKTIAVPGKLVNLVAN